MVSHPDLRMVPFRKFKLRLNGPMARFCMHNMDEEVPDAIDEIRELARLLAIDLDHLKKEEDGKD